jgi:hypothetical protein
MKEIGKIHFCIDNFYVKEFEVSQLASSYIACLTSMNTVTKQNSTDWWCYAADIQKSELVGALHDIIKKSKHHFHFFHDKLLSLYSFLMDSFLE